MTNVKKLQMDCQYLFKGNRKTCNSCKYLINIFTELKYAFFIFHRIV